MITIDLLTDGLTVVDEAELAPPLGIAVETCGWMRERIERDGVQSGVIHSATLTLRPIADAGRLSVSCQTSIDTTSGTFESQDVAYWHGADVADVRTAQEGSN